MWTPQPKQQQLLSSYLYPIVFFGGARGGGKTDGCLGDFLQHVPEGRDWRGLWIRQSYPELREVIERAREIYEPTGGKYRAGDKEIRWPNGASIIFQALKSREDLTKIQGWGRPWICVDEAANYPTDDVFRLSFGSNRGHRLARIRLTGNPGGAGHSWCKQTFIDPADEHGFFDLEVEGQVLGCRYIKSTVRDNAQLLKKDPHYIAKLANLGSPELVRAWLEGDWDVVLGAYFPEFSKHYHVSKPFPMPVHWARWRAIDWGMSHPAVCLWMCLASDDLSYAPVKRGGIVVYREFYTGGSTDKGNKMIAPEFADIVQRMGEEKYTYDVADPSCLNQRGPVMRGPSIGEAFNDYGIRCIGGDNNRLMGWAQLRTRLQERSILIFDSCKHLIRTLPLLQHDDMKPEDLDTNGPDHLADALRYGLMTRQIETVRPEFERRLKGVDAPEDLGAYLDSLRVNHGRRRSHLA